MSDDLHRIPVLHRHFGDIEFSLNKLGNSRINDVYLASKTAHKSIIFKHAPAFFPALGNNFPLSPLRLKFEADALKLFSRLVPNLVPKLINYDQQGSALLIEYIENAQLLSDTLAQTPSIEFLANKLSDFLANTLFFTSNFAMNYVDKSKLESDYDNYSLRQFTDDTIFTLPYQNHSANQHNQQDSELAKLLCTDRDLLHQVARMQYIFTTHKEALLHGNFSSSSVLISNDRLTVFDLQCVFVGPMGFDLGTMIASLLLNFSSKKMQHIECDDMLDLMIKFYTQFERKFTDLWFAATNYKRPEFLKAVFNDALGFAACEIIRRVLGSAGSTDILSIADTYVRNKAEKLAINIAVYMLKNRFEITDISVLAKKIKLKLVNNIDNIGA